MKSPRLLLCFFTLVAGATLSRADITDGLVSYWPLDVTNVDGTTPDLSFGNSLYAVGGPFLGSGQVSNALTLNNGGSRFLGLTNAANSGALFPNAFSGETNGLPIWRAGAYSVLMWVKGTNQTARFIFSEGATNNANPIFIIQTGQAAANNTKLDVVLRGDGGYAYINHPFSATVVFDNSWHHVAWVDNRGRVSLYIDGVLDANSANFNYIYQDGTLTLNTLAVGALLRTTAAASFVGSVDELAIWERPLSQAEVNQVRTNGVYTPGAAIPPRPVSFYVPPAPVKHIGDWNIFRIRPMGNRPISPSQWFKNGLPLTDGTNRTWFVSGLTTNNSGDVYTVVTSNSFSGAVTSAPVTLTVIDDPPANTLNGLVNYWPLDVYTMPDTNLLSPELHFGHDMVFTGLANTNDFTVDPGSQIVPGATNIYGRQFSNAVFCVAGFPTYGRKLTGPAIFAGSNYTVALWVNANGIGQLDRRVFSEGSTLSATPLWTLGTDNLGTTPSATAFVRNDANVSSEINGRKSARAVFDGNWHHIAWTDASGQGKLYVDGILDETDYTYTRTALTLNLTEIGAAARAPAPVNPITGTIDEVATWSRVLSWTEIQQVISNGVPVPSSITAPSIVVQPPNLTNSIFTGDNVSFPVQALGSLPFVYQWRQNGTNMDVNLNPTAATDTLMFGNVQPVLSNTTYSVVITNAAGSVTSSVVRLFVIPYTPASTGLVLAVDFGAVGAPNALPGFAEMTLASNPSIINTLRVTVSLIGTGPLADRVRTAAPLVVNNPPRLTQAQIYDDFIFNNDGTFTDGRGLSILVEHLAPGTNYGVTLWSFDPVSAPDRISDWTETASGTPVSIQSGYDFNGSIQPTNDFNCTLGGLLTASPDGKLQLEGVRHGGTSFGVFINALRLVANPVPRTRVVGAGLDNANIRVSAVGEYPNQEISLEQTADLANGPWVPALNGTAVSTNGMVVDIDFPLDPVQPQIFYRGKPAP